MDDYLLVCQNHPYLDDYYIAFSIERLMSSIIIQYWMILFIQYWMWPFSSIIGCFMSSLSGWNLWYNNHPLLDVTCHHFLDETYTVQLSSIVGCSLSSLSGWKLCKEMIIPYWMILAITFWMKLISTIIMDVILFDNFMLQVKLFLAVSNMDKWGEIDVGVVCHNGSVLEWP